MGDVRSDQDSREGIPARRAPLPRWPANLPSLPPICASAYALPITSDALIPPNPNELLMTLWGSAGRPDPAT